MWFSTYMVNLSVRPVNPREGAMTDRDRERQKEREQKEREETQRKLLESEERARYLKAGGEKRLHGYYSPEGVVRPIDPDEE
jgi:hypothetical protein